MSSWIRIRNFVITDPPPHCFSKNSKEMQKKFNIIIFNGLITVPFENIVFQIATKMSREDPDPAGSLINLASRTPICDQDYGSASRRNIYRSTTPPEGLFGASKLFK
jgi:hypothetical protein